MGTTETKAPTRDEAERLCKANGARLGHRWGPWMWAQPSAVLQLPARLQRECVDCTHREHLFGGCVIHAGPCHGLARE